MSKKSFEDIEQVIKNAAEANTPAFDEAAWKKMEQLLDKEKDRRRPFIFWLWWLVPLLIGGGLILKYAAHRPDAAVARSVSRENLPENRQSINTPDPAALEFAEKENLPNTGNGRVGSRANEPIGPGVQEKDQDKFTARVGNSKSVSDAEAYGKNKIARRSPGKIIASISAPSPQTEGDADTGVEYFSTRNKPDQAIVSGKTEEILVVKIESEKGKEKEVEKMIDSLVEKAATDKKNKKNKNRLARFYVIVSTGAEASGVKLLSADKITARTGLSVGYQLNKNLSVQTGFYVSSKKYKAGPGDYKTKPGSYWNTVAITSIDANCRVYEIPLNIRYDFNTGKKIQLFAAAGLSSYIMKKEEYNIYYNRYGTPHEHEVYYQGNKSLFSVLRVSAGAEKKIGKQFSIFASPGLAIPLAGVGEGEVKLYSTDLTIGLKFTPARRK